MHACRAQTARRWLDAPTHGAARTARALLCRRREGCSRIGHAFRDCGVRCSRAPNLSQRRRQPWRAWADGALRAGRPMRLASRSRMPALPQSRRPGRTEDCRGMGRPRAERERPSRALRCAVARGARRVPPRRVRGNAAWHATGARSVWSERDEVVSKIIFIIHRSLPMSDSARLQNESLAVCLHSPQCRSHRWPHVRSSPSQSSRMSTRRSPLRT